MHTHMCVRHTLGDAIFMGL
ncbi:MAG: hypothetical protein QXP38_09770 [Nitrososphaerota archaeon]